MEKKVEYLEANPKVEEKIIYRENTETLNALKKKRDELQQAVWEKEEARRRLSEENAGLKSAMAKVKKELEDSTRGHFAILITRRGAVSGPMELEGIEARMIDSAAYYLLKADEAEFRRTKGVRGQMLILPLEEMKRQYPDMDEEDRKRVLRAMDGRAGNNIYSLIDDTKSVDSLVQQARVNPSLRERMYAALKDPQKSSFLAANGSAVKVNILRERLEAV
jgi:hypothetical protein